MYGSKLWLLSTMAILATFAVLASSASAAIKFEWKVGGHILEAGETREGTVTTDGHTFDFHATVAGAEALLLSKELSAEPGSKIIGGKPGTGEGTLVIKGVTVDKPEKCAVESEGSPTGTVKMDPGRTEIVESEETHEPLILFAPKTGTVFVSILFLNDGTEVCPVKGVLANVTGSVLAQPLPSLAETLNGDLDFEAPTKNFFLSNGTLDKAGLIFAGNAATLTGLTLVISKTDEKGGAF